MEAIIQEAKRSRNKRKDDDWQAKEAEPRGKDTSCAILRQRKRQILELKFRRLQEDIRHLIGTISIIQEVLRIRIGTVHRKEPSSRNRLQLQQPLLPTLHEAIQRIEETKIKKIRKSVQLQPAVVKGSLLHAIDRCPARYFCKINDKKSAGE